MDLLSGCFEFMCKNILDNSDYPLFQSMLKVFYFFTVKFKFGYDEVTDICIHCNHCSKTVTCNFSEKVTIDILTVFIKDSVLHHVGLSWMIETKYQYIFSVEEKFTEWCTGGLWFYKTIFGTYMAPYLRNYLSLTSKIDTT